MTVLKYIFITLMVVVAFITLLAMTTYRKLPANTATPSATLPVDKGSLLAHHISQETDKHPNKTGVYVFADGLDAFVARLSLVETAQHSLDIRYYIWKNDISGHLLTQRVYAAAERGVRVRILLDDNTLAGMDGILKTLNSHPNIQVRLFNPFMHRKFRWLGFLSDFKRLNQRMHNKSFTADGVVSIVGGRNVGDEYFGAGDGVMFADMDVAVVGAVMGELNQDFDRYWASERAYPAELIIPSDTAFVNLTTMPKDEPATQRYLNQLKTSDYANRLIYHTVNFHWTDARLMSDNPVRTHERVSDTVTAQILPYFDESKSRLTIVSPYFVPTKFGTNWLNDVAKDTHVTILTNSLSANDVVAVHSGYAKYRKPLLANGIELYELKTESAPITQKKKQGLGGSFRGGSGSSLHAKTFIVDDRYLFVGSYNLDPRSAIHNTEMGIIFDAPIMAKTAQEQIDVHLSDLAYKVQLENHELTWHSYDEQGNATIHHQDPNTKWYQRAGVWVLSWLPIEGLL